MSQCFHMLLGRDEREASRRETEKEGRRKEWRKGGKQGLKKKKKDESESRRPVVFKVPNSREEDSI